jgi:diaminohydroxyphosphoribosylaminopyrimidine deaminase / 5-amino-6-(5-phosphoribosylamino)uracil reductase
MPGHDDARFMALALRLAERGLGQTWPNPTVGCVVVRGGRIIGRGWTQPGGRPHAEVLALARAGAGALGATAYVSLEPCAHYGRTPPCTMALLHAGVRRVVVATNDPDPRVDGKGIAQLRQAGVEVDLGVLCAEAEALNEGFFSRIRRGRPLVTLKLAASLDGRIATRTGASRWITGEAARARAHLLRASHDAIMVGSGTALADDPALTCRLPGLEARSPLRVVLDGRLRLATSSKLALGAREVATWIVTSEQAPATRARALERAGVRLFRVAANAEGNLDLVRVLSALAKEGLSRILVEGGAGLAGALLRARLVDRLVWFQAPLVIGGDGLPAVAAFGAETLAEARRLVAGRETPLAQDRVQTYIVTDGQGAPCSPASSATSGGSPTSAGRRAGV